jgi:hypothetical protein
MAPGAPRSVPSHLHHQHDLEVRNMKAPINKQILAAVAATAQISQQELQDSMSAVTAILTCSEFLEHVRQSYLSFHYNSAMAFCEQYAGMFSSTEFVEMPQSRTAVIRMYSRELARGVELRIEPRELLYMRLECVRDVWLRGLVRRQAV